VATREGNKHRERVGDVGVGSWIAIAVAIAAALGLFGRKKKK
jgi:LPXTG-motif cell wall-anchored protein